MRFCGKALPPKAATLLGSNIVLLCGFLPAILVLHGWTMNRASLGFPGALSMLIRLIPVGLLCQVVFYYHELYNLQIIRRFNEQLWRLLQGIGVAMILLAGVYTLMPGWSPGTDALMGLAPCLIAVVVGTRLLALPGRRSRVAIIGHEDRRISVLETIEACPEWNLEPVQAFDGDEVHRTAVVRSLDHVIVCEDARHSPRLIDLLMDMKMTGVRVESAADFFEQATGRVYVDETRPEWFVFSSGFENGSRKRIIKRGFDLMACSVIFIFGLPIMLLAALIIFLEGKGPVLFCQDRTGLHGKVFRIFKFRTMVPAPIGDTPKWTTNNDKRITPIGKLMRTFRIDELPQLLNVLRGEMSLVGPRPEQPFFCDLLAREIPFYRQRHTVLPGLTGWAQVRYQYGASIEESKRKLEFDLFYVKHLSLWLDMAIIFETVKVVLVGRGAK
jgi:exopolysaccharide biosynthesis polyprenyl glycosylphosphotransferase